MAEQISPRLAYKSVIILVMCMTIILTVNGLALALNPQHFGDDLGLYEMPAALPSQTSIANSSTQPAAEEGEQREVDSIASPVAESPAAEIPTDTTP